MTKTNYSPAQRAAMAHNSLIGLSVAIQKNARTIFNAPSVTNDARSIADIISANANALEAALRAGRKS